MPFTTPDGAALKAALTSGGGCVLRESASYQFSDLAGAQQWTLEGNLKVDSGYSNNCTISWWNGSTAVGTLGVLTTIPRSGGSITGAAAGGGVTSGTILQQESETNTVKHFVIPVTLPDPTGGLEWRITIDPDSSTTGRVRPVEFTKLTLRRTA